MRQSFNQQGVHLQDEASTVEVEKQKETVSLDFIELLDQPSPDTRLHLNFSHKVMNFLNCLSHLSWACRCNQTFLTNTVSFLLPIEKERGCHCSHFIAEKTKIPGNNDNEDF